MPMKKVMVYSTPTCPNCTMARSFLDSHDVPYQSFNVAEDKAALEEMIRKSGGMSVPVIEVDGEIVIGFDQVALREKLGR
jgi:glutaredoxin-like YruB-family protein